MVNTHKVYDLEEYKSITNESELKEAQKKLKSIPNSELPMKMLTTTVSAMEKGQQVVSEVCKTINGWTAFNNVKEDDMNNKFANESKFIEEINKNEDFVNAYIIDEAVSTIILIIKESIFAYNKKYLRYAREFKQSNGCEFNLSIFDLDDLDEVKEQLKYMKVYER